LVEALRILGVGVTGVLLSFLVVMFVVMLVAPLASCSGGGGVEEDMCGLGCGDWTTWGVDDMITGGVDGRLTPVVELVPVVCGWSARRVGWLLVKRGDCSSRFSWKTDDMAVFECRYVYGQLRYV
jgi:hypothetical protein